MSARVLSGVPNTEKQMKARGCRPSAFIVSRCLEPLIKPEARVFDMASLAIRGYCFIALISHEIMCLNNNQNVGNLSLFVVSHGGVKIDESFAANTVSHFHCPKNWGRRIKVVAREYS